MVLRGAWCSGIKLSELTYERAENVTVTASIPIERVDLGRLNVVPR